MSDGNAGQTSKQPRPEAAPDGRSTVITSTPDEWAKQKLRHATIGEAKLAVMREVDYCQKVQSQGLRYAFAGEAQLLAVIRPSMVRNGITITPIRMEILESAILTTSNDKKMQLVRIAVTFALRVALLDGTDACESIMSLGEASDTMDKAVNKAMTDALKYALRQAFLIETGDDPDRHASQDVVAVGQGEKLRRESIPKFIGGIAVAESHETLDKLTKAIKDPGRNFTAAETQALMGAIEHRGRQLNATHYDDQEREP